MAGGWLLGTPGQTCRTTVDSAAPASSQFLHLFYILGFHMYFHLQKQFGSVQFFNPSHQRVEKVQRRKGRCSKNRGRASFRRELRTHSPRATPLHATPPADIASRTCNSFPVFPQDSEFFCNQHPDIRSGTL